MFVVDSQWGQFYTSGLSRHWYQLIVHENHDKPSCFLALESDYIHEIWTELINQQSNYLALSVCLTVSSASSSCFSGARALASVTPCASWQRCWATWSLARWLASPRLSPSCWRRPCWSAAGWWGSDCQTHAPMSSCKTSTRNSLLFTRYLLSL